MKVDIIQNSNFLNTVYKNKKIKIPKKKRQRKKWLKKNRESYLLYVPMETGVSILETIEENYRYAEESWISWIAMTFEKGKIK